MLRECESYCQLVSHSTIVRIDVGAEFEVCRGSVSEQQLMERQKTPQQWQTTGAGRIVRFFVKKVRGETRQDRSNLLNRRIWRCSPSSPLCLCSFVCSPFASFFVLFAEVNSTLDVKWYSAPTGFPMGMVAARALARQIARIAHQQQLQSTSSGHATNTGDASGKQNF